MNTEETYKAAFVDALEKIARSNSEKDIDKKREEALSKINSEYASSLAQYADIEDAKNNSGTLGAVLGTGAALFSRKSSSPLIRLLKAGAGAGLGYVAGTGLSHQINKKLNPEYGKNLDKAIDKYHSDEDKVYIKYPMFKESSFNDKLEKISKKLGSDQDRINKKYLSDIKKINSDPQMKKDMKDTYQKGRALRTKVGVGAGAFTGATLLAAINRRAPANIMLALAGAGGLAGAPIGAVSGALLSDRITKKRVKNLPDSSKYKQMYLGNQAKSKGK